MKRLKPFLALRPFITRLKPGANETENFRGKELRCARAVVMGLDQFSSTFSKWQDARQCVPTGRAALPRRRIRLGMGLRLVQRTQFAIGAPESYRQRAGQTGKHLHSQQWMRA